MASDRTAPPQRKPGAGGTGDTERARGGCLGLLVELRGFAAVLAWWTASAVLLAVVSVVALVDGAGPPGDTGGLLAVAFSLAVAGPVLLYAVVKPLCLAGRLLARRYGRHRITGALALLFPLVVAVAALAGIADEPALGVGLGVGLAFLLTPAVVVYAALRPDTLPDEEAPWGGGTPEHALREAERVRRRDLADLAGRAPAPRRRDGVLHRERTPKAWSSLVVGAYLAGVAWMASGVDVRDGEDLRALLAVSGMFLLLFVLPLLIAPFMKYRYDRIVLTGRVLRVGRHRVAVEDLLPETASTAVPEGGARRGSAAEAARGDLLPLGGRPLWSAPPARSTPVYVATRSGRLLCVDARRPEQLVRALSGLRDAPLG